MRLLAALLSLSTIPASWGGGAVAPSERPATGSPGVTAGGSLSWVFDRDFEIAGTMWARIPIFRIDDHPVELSFEALTEIARATSDFRLLVRGVVYRAELRPEIFDSPRLRLRTVAGLWGRERVDAPGGAAIGYVGLGLEAPRPLEIGGLVLDGGFTAGAVVGRHVVDSHALARAEGRLLVPLRSGVLLGADAAVNALIGNSDSGIDTAIGPRLELDLARARTFTLFVRHLRNETPLSPRRSGWSVGFEYSQRGSAAGEPARPDVGGEVAIGGGARRAAARLNLRLTSPSWGRSVRGVAEIDAHALTTAGPGELYYLYHVGVERVWERWIAGGWFYHRSSHRLAARTDEVTSINVLEGGVESRGWSEPPEADLPRGRAAFEFRARAGWLVSSRFGLDHRWHVRGGARISVSAGAGWSPMAAVEAEAGDVSRLTLALGVSAPHGFEIRAEWRRDSQYYDATTSPWLLLAAIRY